MGALATRLLQEITAGDHSRSVKGSVLVKDELQNRVPAKLLTEILAALKD